MTFNSGNHKLSGFYLKISKWKTTILKKCLYYTQINVSILRNHYSIFAPEVSISSLRNENSYDRLRVIKSYAVDVTDNVNL
jgi:hypothetical protein